MHIGKITIAFRELPGFKEEYRLRHCKNRQQMEEALSWYRLASETFTDDRKGHPTRELMNNVKILENMLGIEGAKKVKLADLFATVPTLSREVGYYAVIEAMGNLLIDKENESSTYLVLCFLLSIMKGQGKQTWADGSYQYNVVVKAELYNAQVVEMLEEFMHHGAHADRDVLMTLSKLIKITKLGKYQHVQFFAYPEIQNYKKKRR